MKVFIYIFIALILTQTSFGQSPSKRYTYSIDSIRYTTYKNLNNEMSRIENSPLQMVTIDYGNNVIKLHLMPLKDDESYPLLSIKEDKSEKGQTAYTFSSKDSKGQPYELALVLFDRNMDHPILAVRNTKDMYFYYLKEF
jgi:hypothetical protein